MPIDLVRNALFFTCLPWVEALALKLSYRERLVSELTTQNVITSHLSFIYAARSTWSYFPTMSVSCSLFSTARSLSGQPIPASHFVTQVQRAPQRPVLPVNFTARTTQRCIRSKAWDAEKSVAAVKAWAEQHEVCFLTLAENNVCLAKY